MSSHSPRTDIAQPKKMCKACFAVLHPDAEICPKCGVRQFHPISKVALLLITFFLGAFGAHKFYVGKNIQGVFYLLFCWSGIPGFIAFIEFLVYIFTDEKHLRSRYSDAHGGAAVAVVAGVAGAFIMVAIIGILAAIAIPQFVVYRERAACSIVESEAQLVSIAVSQYFLDESHKSAPSMTELTEMIDYVPNEQVDIRVSGDSEGFTVTARDMSERCPNGQVYILNEPSDQGRDGWQQ